MLDKVPIGIIKRVFGEEFGRVEVNGNNLQLIGKNSSISSSISIGKAESKVRAFITTFPIEIDMKFRMTYVIVRVSDGDNVIYDSPTWSEDYITELLLAASKVVDLFTLEDKIFS